MSEYPCYEFVVLDCPLFVTQMAELRAISTRTENRRSDADCIAAAVSGGAIVTDDREPILLASAAIASSDAEAGVDAE